MDPSTQLHIQDRKQLRRHMRQQRRSLTPQQQHDAAIQLCTQLSKLHRLKAANAIAAYLPNDGEISPIPFMNWAHSHGKSLFLPTLHPIKKGQLWFVEYQPNSRMRVNRFGILEPDPRFNAVTPLWALDTVLLPLVAFDRFGGRLGMGGGYYDRTFAYRQQLQPFNKPTLIGLAHQLQEVSQLPVENWDIPLSAIVTNEQSIDC